MARKFKRNPRLPHSTQRVSRYYQDSKEVTEVTNSRIRKQVYLFPPFLQPLITDRPDIRIYCADQSVGGCWWMRDYQPSELPAISSKLQHETGAGHGVGHGSPRHASCFDVTTNDSESTNEQANPETRYDSIKV